MCIRFKHTVTNWHGEHSMYPLKLKLHFVQKTISPVVQSKSGKPCTVALVRPSLTQCALVPFLRTRHGQVYCFAVKFFTLRFTDWEEKNCFYIATLMLTERNVKLIVQRYQTQFIYYYFRDCQIRIVPMKGLMKEQSFNHLILFH